MEQAKDRGLLRGRWALLDGTKVVAHAAVRNNLELVREGRRKLLKVLARNDPAAAEEVKPLTEPELDSDYANHKELLEAEKEKGLVLLDRLAERTEQMLPVHGSCAA